MLTLIDDLLAIIFSRISLSDIYNLSRVSADYFARVNTFSTYMPQITIIRSPKKEEVAFLERIHPRHIIIGRDDGSIARKMQTVCIPDIIMHCANRVTVMVGYRLFVDTSTLKNIARLKLMDSANGIYRVYVYVNEPVETGVTRFTCHNMSTCNFAIEDYAKHVPHARFKYYAKPNITADSAMWLSWPDVIGCITIIGDSYVMPASHMNKFNAQMVVFIRCKLHQNYFSYNDMHTLILHDTKFESDCGQIAALKNIILSGDSEFIARGSSTQYNITAPDPKLLAKLERKASRMSLIAE